MTSDVANFRSGRLLKRGGDVAAEVRTEVARVGNRLVDDGAEFKKLFGKEARRRRVEFRSRRVEDFVDDRFFFREVFRFLKAFSENDKFEETNAVDVDRFFRFFGGEKFADFGEIRAIDVNKETPKPVFRRRVFAFGPTGVDFAARF